LRTWQSFRRLRSAAPPAAPRDGKVVSAVEDGNYQKVVAGSKSAFNRHVELELERARRGGRPVSLLVSDLTQADEASPESDVPLSESALTQMGALVSGHTREIDTVGLIGPGRLGLVLPETGEHGALALAGRLRAAITHAFGADAVPPKLRFGVASFPRHGRTADSLFRAADRAVVAASALGDHESIMDSGDLVGAMAAVGRGSVEADGRLGAALALADTVDIRDKGQPGHAHVVGRYAQLIAREFGLPENVVERIRLAGVLHDVGKVGIPGAILQRGGPLSEEEWETVRRHPEIGAHILEGAGLDDVRDWVLHHHERPDGRGYPYGLKGAETPLGGRILAVASAYEAMTNDCPYRPAMSHAAAREELSDQAGSQFDRRVVDAFLRCLERHSHGTRQARVAG
jgi:HD-GYP domain-containing protein (c-di-GMP phosphodiesterase class II)